MTDFQQGEVVACDVCQYARPLTTPVIEQFGNRVAFGPGGHADMFIERDGEVTCYRCADDPPEVEHP